VLNITRVYSALSSVGHLRRCIVIANAYAKVRSVERGGEQQSLLVNIPLHIAQLASINTVYRAITHLTFGAVGLLGGCCYGGCYGLL